MKHVTKAVLLALAATACNMYDIVGDGKLPSDVTDPRVTQTQAGAMAAYYGTLAQFRGAYGREFTSAAGVLSDEMTYAFDQYDGLDFRVLPSDPTHFGYNAYSTLQKTRGLASQARGLLERYAPEAPELRAHMYAIEGYAEIMLAELFCSGVPLSTLDFAGDYTMKPGSTTADVFRHAVALFDSALLVAGDSVRFANLARVGQGRARLALGEYQAAADAVTDVPDDYAYLVRFSSADGAAASNFAGPQREGDPRMTVANSEGINGLPFVSAGDPRAAIIEVSGYFGTLYRAAKYDEDGSSPMVLANGVEARLIQAEAALKVGSPSWLTTLNALRTDGTFTTQPNPDDPAVEDTVWNAGSGGVAGLAPLDDPGNDVARVDLLFRERAYWLFLTGHRQGDMRRLIRQYGRGQQAVYPIGPYQTGTNASYGTDVNVPIPPEETATNPHFHGCLSRGA